MLNYLRKTWQVYWFGMKVCISVHSRGVGEQGEMDSLLIKTLHIALIPFNYGERYLHRCWSPKRPGLRPNVHTIHPKFYVIVVIFNTI